MVAMVFGGVEGHKLHHHRHPHHKQHYTMARGLGNIKMLQTHGIFDLAVAKMEREEEEKENAISSLKLMQERAAQSEKA